MAHVTVSHRYLMYGYVQYTIQTSAGKFKVYANRRASMYLLLAIANTGKFAGSTRHTFEWDIPEVTGDLCSVINFMGPKEARKSAAMVLNGKTPSGLEQYLKVRGFFHAALDKQLITLSPRGCTASISSKIPTGQSRSKTRKWAYSVKKGLLDIVYETNERPNEQMQFAAFVLGPVATLAKWVKVAGARSTFGNEWRGTIIRVGEHSFGGVTKGAAKPLTRKLSGIIERSVRSGRPVEATYLVES